MLSPVVKNQMKGEILKELVQKIHVRQVLTVFLDTVSESGRVSAIPAISRSLKREILEIENTVEATIARYLS